MPGPTPTPTPILKLHGSWRANARERAGEPIPPPGRPRKPASVKGKAAETWRRVVPLLCEMGVATPADQIALEQYCRLRGLWDDLMAFLEENGTTYTVRDKGGKMKDFKAFPQFRQAMAIGDQMLKLGQEFGLTPASRTRLRVPPADRQDDTADKSRFFRSGVRGE